MLPARQIAPPDWMTDYRTVKLMRVLGGYEPTPEALFVGGCVRNTLLGKPVSDIDITTIHHPLQVIEKLKAVGLRYAPTGLEHGTVTAIVDDGVFEITTLRKDIDTDGRHAVISFTTEWEVDAQRRDFTINTLLASPEGAVYDPTGQGLADLDAKRVVFVGDPAQRIAEDFLRIFRFFRFHAQYGENAPDAAALKACGDLAHNIPSLSRERITQEFLKIMDVPDPSATLQLMVKSGVAPCLEKTFKENVLRSLCELQGRHEAKDIMARLLAIGDMKPNYFEDGLMFSNAQKKHLESLALGLALLKRPTKKKLRELIYRIGNRMALQTYLLKLTQKNDLPNLELLDIARYWQAPEFPIKAMQLIDAGVPQGPMLGQRLKALEDKWIAKDFPANFAHKK